MNETKTKISLVWYCFCLLWLLVILPFFTTSARTQLGQKNNFAPQVLGAYTTAPRGSLALSPAVPPLIRGPISLDDVKAKSFLVYDQDSKAVLFSRDPDEKLPIASLTKLLTALVAYDNLDLNNYYTTPQNVGVHDEPSLNIAPGEQIKGIDLFNAMLIGSENDAAQIFRLLVEQKTGRSFIDLMNQKAAQLGMENSEFSNAMGFYSDSNYSTADDLKKLVDATQSKSPFVWVGKQTGYTFETQSGSQFHVKATNKLIQSHPDIFAIKTGYTKESMGSMATKVVTGGHSVIIIVIGSPDRETDTLLLRKFVENNVKWQ